MGLFMFIYVRKDLYLSSEKERHRALGPLYLSSWIRYPIGSVLQLSFRCEGAVIPRKKRK